MALMQTVQRNLNNNSIPSGFGTFGTGFAYTNQRLEMQSQLASTYSGLDTGGTTYDLTASFASVQYIGHDAGATSIASFEPYPLNLSDSGGTNALQIFMQYSGGAFQVRSYKKVSGASTQVATETYNTARHRWFRIREASGTTYWEYSSNGRTWITMYSEANPITVTALRYGIMLGTWQAEATQAKAYFDNFNLPSFIPLISS